MTRAARVMFALALLVGAACEDPTLLAGDAPEPLSEDDDAAVDANVQASRDASDDGRIPTDDRPDPRDLWRNLPKECRSCSNVRSPEDCRFDVPPTAEDIERFGCLECGCCEETAMCKQIAPNFSCIALIRERDSVGVCRPTFGGGGGGGPP